MPKSFVLNFDELKENPCVLAGMISELSQDDTRLGLDLTYILQYLNEKYNQEFTYRYQDYTEGRVSIIFEGGGDH